MNICNQTTLKEKLLDSLSNNAKCLDALAVRFAKISFSITLRSVSDTLRRVYSLIASLNNLSTPALVQLLEAIEKMMWQCILATLLLCEADR